MILKEVILQNFRGYKEETRIPIDGLTAFIGKNDVGKSTVLDALAIFFEQASVKIDSSDICVFSGATGEVIIGCVFSDLPAQIIIDDASTTTLEQEHLLNQNGDLEIHQVYEFADHKLGKPKVFAIANHPTNPDISNLLQKKNQQLKTISRSLGITDVDERSNVSLRQAIWRAVPNLNLQLSRIQLDKLEEKTIVEHVQKLYPLFALFRADRPSTDEDAEVQNPLKFAIKQAIAEVEDDLERIKDEIQNHALEVANRTLVKLADFDPELAAQLIPDFKSDPKWDSIFKLSLLGDDNIPINKRGSGVRRLILFSFFSAEAERLKEEADKHNVIFAIEEPETAQHPINQVKLFEALESIVMNSSSQILLTTHVPGLAALLPINSIRYVQKNDELHTQTVIQANDELLPVIAKELGVIPDKRAKVLICVEGPNDIHFLRHMSLILFQNGDINCDVFNDSRFAHLILGGSTLQSWVSEHYLSNIGLREFHLYDRDNINQQTQQHHYQREVDTVNRRGDGSIALLTTRREIENYLHINAINAYFEPLLGNQINIVITADSDVENDIMPFLRGRHWGRNPKSLLNHEVAEKMTVEMLHDNGTFDEIKGWFDTIIEMAQ